MSEMEEKISGILSNPAMMQQIMGMAKMLSAQQPPQSQQPPQAPNPPAAPPQMPGGDMLQSLAGVLNQGGTDTNQQSLLSALQPYLSRERIVRLERAMHAARMAGAASVLLGSGGFLGR